MENKNGEYYEFQNTLNDFIKGITSIDWEGPAGLTLR